MPRKSLLFYLIDCSKIFSLLLLSYLLSGCSHNPVSVQVKDLRPPPQVVTGLHRVQKGETLYAIAWLYGRDFRELAASNGITSPYLIYPGQQIDLSGPPVKIRKKTYNASVVKKNTALSKGKKRPVSASVRWQWPVSGRVIEKFSLSPRVNKGIDIGGNLGESVKAAAAGKVVYAGSELKGYGRLIILKHNNSYLSAYAHNRELNVREGDLVKAGQKIAEIGSTGATEPKLHFEIRRNGKPVDPMGYLPKR